jgi:hypothetical protein
MLFRKKYSLQLDQNKDTLTQSLKDLSKKDQVKKNIIGDDTLYSVEFNWDEFVVTRKPKMFERLSLAPNAYMRLASSSENITQVDVKIKFSEISWIFLVFIHLGIIAACIFSPQIKLFGSYIETNWLTRIFSLFILEGILNLIIWLIFTQGSNALKKVVKQLFE